MKLFTISQPFGTAYRPSSRVFLISRGRALYPHVGGRGLFPFSRVFIPLELYHSRNVSAIVTRLFQHISAHFPPCQINKKAPRASYRNEPRKRFSASF
jgi:hypothetical protein